MTSCNPPANEQTIKQKAQVRKGFIKIEKFTNSIPDLPFEPKSLEYEIDFSSAIPYQPISYEKDFQFELHVEADLGINIAEIDSDSCDSDRGSITQDVSLDADEKQLLEIEITKLSQKRSRSYRKVVPWLKKTEYISTHFNRFGRNTAAEQKCKVKYRYNAKRLFKRRKPCTYKELRNDYIIMTFEESQKPIVKHFKESNVYPIEVLPLIPGLKSWDWPFTYVSFDSDADSEPNEDEQRMPYGILQSAPGKLHVSHFLPIQDTLYKTEYNGEWEKILAEGKPYKYQKVGEYNCKVSNDTLKNKDGDDESYFIKYNGKALVYNKMNIRVSLGERRKNPRTEASAQFITVMHEPIETGEMKTHSSPLDEKKISSKNYRRNLVRSAATSEKDLDSDSIPDSEDDETSCIADRETPDDEDDVVSTDMDENMPGDEDEEVTDEGEVSVGSKRELQAFKNREVSDEGNMERLKQIIDKQETTTLEKMDLDDSLRLSSSDEIDEEALDEDNIRKKQNRELIFGIDSE